MANANCFAEINALIQACFAVQNVVAQASVYFNSKTKAEHAAEVVINFLNPANFK